MFFTGFADEAAFDIDGQIAATRELGWNCIESRNINGVNIHDISESDFVKVADSLDRAGIHVNCFGSAIANWAKHIDADTDDSFAELRRAIPRMQRLGTEMIRIMSYAVLPGRGPDEQMAEERFRRLREMTAMLRDAGITPVHENCMNYGGMGWRYTLRLIENVPGLKLVFDTGNPVFADDMIKPEPRPNQSAWEFYEHVREHVVYIHIKDCRWLDNGNVNKEFTFPGDGQGDVERILYDMVKRGYDGGISIEPHLALVVHEDSVRKKEDVMRSTYIEYGRRIMRMIENIQKTLRPA